MLKASLQFFGHPFITTKYNPIDSCDLMPLRKYPSASRKSETQPMSMTISQKTRTNTEGEEDNIPEFQQKSLFCITFRGEHLQIKGIWGSMAMQHIRDFKKESEVKRKRKGHTIVDETWSVQKNIRKANLKSTCKYIFGRLEPPAPHPAPRGPAHL